ncbi:hypothetical protein K456DRAFT_927281 [Colletotrichum gloeosporioides 23]|nr:hypothetical protein K456DRAFT_927281 [Colletotrichum gloeosporioides 23]
MPSSPCVANLATKIPTHQEYSLNLSFLDFCSTNMGNCSAYMEPQNASGDIVGYGMLAAFLSSAVMTITAVLLAYYCDAMDDDLMTDRDLQLKCRIRRITDSIKHLFQDGIRKFRGKTIQHGDDLLLHNEVETQTNLREHRKACFTRFILALSDQQLVTGLAILITTLSSRKRLSNFEFSVAHSLAWFSSTTHLVTMDVILPTLKSQNRWVLYGRIVGMYLVLFLLYNTSTETWGTERVWIRPQGCQFISASIPDKIQNYFAFMVIIHEHSKKLADFYMGYCFTWAARFLGFGESRLVSSSQFRAKRLADYRYDKLWAMEKWPQRRHLSQANWEILEYSQAFFSTMPVIFFSLSYGICQVVEFAFLTAPNVTEESREMGFGQLMALFLLILICLAAGESYSDYQKASLSASANNATDTNAAKNKNAEPDQARHSYDAEPKGDPRRPKNLSVSGVSESPGD